MLRHRSLVKLLLSMFVATILTLGMLAVLETQSRVSFSSATLLAYPLPNKTPTPRPPSRRNALLPYSVYLLSLSTTPWTPPATTSRYMTTTDTSLLYTQGCNQGSAGQSGVVVLDFGQPWYDISTSSYGTLLFDSLGFSSTTQIETAVKSFLNGYWNCSLASPSAHIVLAIGLNNFRGETTYAHGQAWAQMVNNIANWIPVGIDYSSKESAAGAMDIELPWNTSTNTSNWINGYASATSLLLYDFGSCDSCPYDQNPQWSPANSWTLENVWYVSYGATPTVPLPEIYNTLGVNASQWLSMSVYAYNNHGAVMSFAGAFTQWQACQDKQDPCTGINNAPSAGWLQLYNALNSSNITVQGLGWSTDITWQNLR